jgi:putative DNA primase/helicase
VLRLPGTLNHKYDPPRPVVVETLTDVTYTVADLVAVVGPLPPAPPERDTTPLEHNVSLAERIAQARAWLAEESPAIEGDGGDNRTYEVCCAVAFGHDLSEDDAFVVLADWNARCVPPWSETDLRRKVRNALRYATGARGDKLRLVLSPNAPLVSARIFVRRNHTVDGVRALHHQHEVFFAYDRAANVYSEHEDGAVRADLYTFLDTAKQLIVNKKTDETAFLPFQPNIAKVSNVQDALCAVCNLPKTFAPPCWLTDDQPFRPLDLLPTRRGLLHVPTRTLLPGTPQLFALNGIDVDYDPNAPEPAHWFQFLRTLWTSDDESIATLQEVFGYTLTPDTRQQKIFMLVGPPRSGKGVTGRVLQRLVGERNTCSPTLASFGRDFGKQVLIGKTLALISDARISSRTDSAIVAETLLSISGEDPQTIERKFLPDWNGTLGVRFLLLTNELPRIGDVSGALAKRFIVLALTESFYGKEDHGLFERLVPELPGILNWALEGRDRLYARGYFVQPASAADLMQEFADLGSDEATFLRERCEVDAAASVEQKRLFVAWQAWCVENGKTNVGTTHTFNRNVRAAMPVLSVVREGPRGHQERCWKGLRLLPLPGDEDRPGFIAEM